MLPQWVRVLAEIKSLSFCWVVQATLQGTTAPQALFGVSGQSGLPHLTDAENALTGFPESPRVAFYPTTGQKSGSE